MDSPLQDAMVLTETPHEEPNGTWATFSVAENIGDRIDYIFVTPQSIRVLKHVILTDSNHENYPSDHLPVLAEIAVKSTSVPTQNIGELGHILSTTVNNKLHPPMLEKIVFRNDDAND